MNGSVTIPVLYFFFYAQERLNCHPWWHDLYNAPLSEQLGQALVHLVAHVDQDLTVRSLEMETNQLQC